MKRALIRLLLVGELPEQNGSRLRFMNPVCFWLGSAGLYRRWAFGCFVPSFKSLNKSEHLYKLCSIQLLLR